MTSAPTTDAWRQKCIRSQAAFFLVRPMSTGQKRHMTAELSQQFRKCPKFTNPTTKLSSTPQNGGASQWCNWKTDNGQSSMDNWIKWSNVGNTALFGGIGSSPFWLWVSDFACWLYQGSSSWEPSSNIIQVYSVHEAIDFHDILGHDTPRPCRLLGCRLHVGIGLVLFRLVFLLRRLLRNHRPRRRGSGLSCSGSWFGSCRRRHGACRSTGCWLSPKRWSNWSPCLESWAPRRGRRPDSLLALASSFSILSSHKVHAALVECRLDSVSFGRTIAGVALSSSVPLGISFRMQINNPSLGIPSGKQPHSYGKIHHFQWLNPRTFYGHVQ